MGVVIDLESHRIFWLSLIGYEDMTTCSYPIIIGVFQEKLLTRNKRVSDYYLIFLFYKFLEKIWGSIEIL